MASVRLKGITWNHVRGYGPLKASNEEYHRVHNEIEITWRRRTLQEFADFPVCKLAKEYDLLVVDHPSLGEAVSGKCLVPLDVSIDKEFLNAQEAQSVGKSNSSYTYAGHQWALAIDAAAQVSAHRDDLLSKANSRVPEDWSSVHELVKRVRRDNQNLYVGLPLVPTDAFSCFVSLCANRGHAPFASKSQAVHEETSVAVLEYLKDLVDYIHPDSLKMNPIDILNLMSESNEVVYIPLVFGYSNYSRAGFKPHLIKFGNIPSSGNGWVGGSLLGGAGLAISSRCQDLAKATEYAKWLASSDIQRTSYFDNGGQPGNKVAWTDYTINKRSNDFFQSTLATLENAYLRPRYDGFLGVQSEWGNVIHQFLKGQSDPQETTEKLNEIFLSSKTADMAY